MGVTEKPPLLSHERPMAVLVLNLIIIGTDCPRHSFHFSVLMDHFRLIIMRQCATWKRKQSVFYLCRKRKKVFVDLFVFGRFRFMNEWAWGSGCINKYLGSKEESLMQNFENIANAWRQHLFNHYGGPLRLLRMRERQIWKLFTVYFWFGANQVSRRLVKVAHELLSRWTTSVDS